MPAILIDSVFNPWDEIQLYQSGQLQSGHYGATASFVGTMRDFNINESVSHMVLEHYPAMTQHFLDELCQQANKQFSLDDCLIIRGMEYPVAQIGQSASKVFFLEKTLQRKSSQYGAKDVHEAGVFFFVDEQRD